MDDNLLEKAKKANIPNTYYALIALAFASIIGIVYLVIVGLQSKEIRDEATHAKPAIAQMPKAARFAKTGLRLNLSRSDVIREMGKPDWAAIPGDKGTLALPDESFGLELRWNNPECRDVVVMFSPPPHRVIGWDDGMTYCRTGIKDDHSDFSCNLPDRKQFCQ
jgi:hypothetical protein